MVSALSFVQPTRPRAGAMAAAATSPSRHVVPSSSSSSSFASSFALPPSAFSAASVSSSSTSASASSSSSSSSIPSSSSSSTTAPFSPSILKTFDAQTDVLITGGIGFVGSVVVEQLLRLTEINKIFLLIRSKKSVNRDDGSETRLTAQQRLDAFVDSSALFDSLRVQQEGGGEKGGRRPRGVFEFGSGRGPLRPEIARKLVAVDGDVSIPKSCGLSDADLAALRSSKKLVFVHSAASIYFTDHMHDLIRMNYGATRNVLELAEEVCGGGGKGKGEVNTSSQSSPPPPSSSSSSSSSPPLAALASRTSFSSSGLPPLARKASAVAPNGHTAQVLAHAGGAAAATTSNSSNSNNTTNSSSASPPPPPPLPSTPTLSAFVHVSTAYVNANRPTGSRVKEMVYSLVDERNAIDRRTRRRLGLVGCGEEEEEGKKRGDGGKSGGADGDGDGDGDGVSSSSSSSSSKTTALTIDHGVLMSSLLSIKDRAQAARVAQGVVDALGFPNAYTLSKNCCEKLVADWHEGRKNGSSSSSSSSSSISSSSSPLKGKIAIVRPTIIGPVGEGESRGYFGNGAGITSLVLAFATGVADSVPWQKSSVFDFVPADNVGACVIGAAALVFAASAGGGGGGAAKEAASSSSSSAPASSSSSTTTHPPYPTSIPVLHSSTSTNNPITFFTLFRDAVYPYFSARPAPAALKIGKPGVYVTPDSPKLYYRDGSLAFFLKKTTQGAAMAARCAFLRARGQHDLARRLSAGFRQTKIYMTKKLDFGLFYCSARVGELSRALPAEEQRMIPLLFKGDWAAYGTRHCEVIEQRYFVSRKGRVGGGGLGSGGGAPAGASSPGSASSGAGAAVAPAAASASTAEENAEAPTRAAPAPAAAPRATTTPRARGAAAASVFASVAVVDQGGSSSGDDEGEEFGGASAVSTQQRMSTILRTISSLGVAAA